MKKIFIILILICFVMPLFGQGLDDMADNNKKKAVKKSKSEKSGGLDDMASDDKNKSKSIQDVKTEEDDKEEENKKKFTLNGYVKGNFYYTKSKDTYDKKDFMGSKIGVVSQLRFEGDISRVAHFFSSFNLEYNQADTSTDNPTLKPRIVEAYVDLYFNWLTIRAGHQLVTWGKTDGFEVPTDNVCPYDYTYLSSEFEDLKRGVSALQLSLFFGGQKLQIFWIPIFQPHIYPANAAISGSYKPSKAINNSEFAFQLSGTIGKFDYALNYFYGNHDLPDFKMTTAMYYKYNTVHIPGFDFSFPLGRFLVKGSYAYFYTSDYKGEDFLKKNSYMKYLIGLEYLSGSNSIGIQAGQKITLNHSDELMPVVDMVTAQINAAQRNALLFFGEVDKIKHIVTGTINLVFLPGNALTFKALFSTAFNNEFKNWSYAVQPVITYKLADGVDTVIGAAFVRRIKQNSINLLLEVKYSF